MGALSDLVNEWSETITISIPDLSTRNEFNQFTTFTDSTIQGRLIQTNEEVVGTDNTKDTAKAKLFTNSDLNTFTRIGDYIILSKKPCKDENNNIEFYKYFLK